MPAYEGIRVEGLRELNQAFTRISKDLGKDLRAEFIAAAEPVKTTAEQFAVARIPNIGPHWSRMRVGATQKTVYVAAAARRRHGSPRKNLAPLLLSRAMVPAVRVNEREVVERVSQMFGRLASDLGF